MHGQADMLARAARPSSVAECKACFVPETSAARHRLYGPEPAKPDPKPITLLMH